MDVIFDERQRAHDPQFRLQDGKVILNPDRPERIEYLLKGALAAGGTLNPPTDHGMAPLAAIHTPRYLDFLQTAYAARKAIVPDLVELVPSRFCRDPLANYSWEPDARAGFHSSDTSCSISEHTWPAIYASAQVALTGADRILAGERWVYALCRPSGHHAYAEISGGFCYLNNSAIAAEHLRVNGHRPAILDIDVHQGNGTQGIFYERSDVLTVSIHVDPAIFRPYYAGAATEQGKGAGLGYNLNLPLPLGTDTALFLRTLDRALDVIGSFGPTVIVVALGLDTHEDDPFKAMRVTTAGFSQIAARIRQSGLPVLNVQEGGYVQPVLGDNLESYLRE